MDPFRLVSPQKPKKGYTTHQKGKEMTWSLRKQGPAHALGAKGSSQRVPQLPMDSLALTMLPVAPELGTGAIGPPAIGAVLPFLFWGRFGSPTKIDYRKKGTLILFSLLEDLAGFLHV